MGYQLAVSGISIQKEIDPTLPVVRGSRNQIEQVLINLFLNARDAVQGKSNPEVIIGTCLVDLEDRQFVSIYVRDNGVGIEEDNVSQIFNPFFSQRRKA